MSARVFVALLGLLTTWSLARAQPTRTALVLVPAQGSALITEISARLSGELAAEGFTVTRRASASSLPPRQAVETAQADADAVLLIAPTGDAGADASLAIWLSDRLAGYTSMARLQNASGEPLNASRLTVRAVELLRARWSERSLSADEVEPNPWRVMPAYEPVAAAYSEPMPPRERARFGVAAGGTWLRSSLGSTWLPMMGLSIFLPLARRFAFDLGLQGGAFGSRLHAGRQEGRARIGPAFALSSAALRLRARWQPSVRVAAGAYVMQVEGRAAAPYQANDAVHVSPLFAAGLGFGSPLWRHLAAAVGADVFLLTHPAAVAVAGQDVAQSGRVGALLHAELRVVF